MCIGSADPLGDGEPLGVEQRGGEIERVAHDPRVRGAHQGERHVVGDGVEAALHELELERVDVAIGGVHAGSDSMRIGRVTQRVPDRRRFGHIMRQAPSPVDSRFRASVFGQGQWIRAFTGMTVLRQLCADGGSHSRFRGNDGSCINHAPTVVVIPAFAGMTVVASTTAMSMASFPLARE